MAWISRDLISRARKRGPVGNVRLLFDLVFARPVSRAYTRLITRSAPEYEAPSGPERLEIERRLEDLGVQVESLRLSPSDLSVFSRRYPFPAEYHGGKAVGVYDEKVLEHFIAFQLCGLEGLDEQDLYIDVAAGGSPWVEILRNSGLNAIAVDLKIRPKLESLPYYLEMDATDTSFADSSISAMSLQCAYEMFCGDDDVKFLDECSRILNPGGVVVISPLYMHTHHCGYSSPELWRKGFADRNATEYIRRGSEGIAFSRKYSPETLKGRILDRLPRLGMSYRLFRVDEIECLGEGVYCHFVLSFKKE